MESFESDDVIVAFINFKSGGQQGAIATKFLSKFVHRIYDLSNGGPAEGVSTYKKDPRVKFIVCGGDGTVCWIMSELDKQEVKKWPPIAILPLGTGNDMARVLLWGNGYEGESLESFVSWVKQSKAIKLDRWKLTKHPLSIQDRTKLEKAKAIEDSFDETDEDDDEEEDLLKTKKKKDTQKDKDNQKEKDKEKDKEKEKEKEKGKTEKDKGREKAEKNDKIKKAETNEKNLKLDPGGKTEQTEHNDKQLLNDQEKKLLLLPSGITLSDSEETLPVNDLSQSTDTKIFNNYFSIGMDGKICLDFHNFRNKNPELFKNKYVNYGWYGAIGLKSAFTHWTPLSKVVVLRIDGQDIKLPKKLLALVILNIPSYGGGADLWGKNSGYWKKQAIDDRMLEVVGLRGAFHMGQVQSGIAQGRRIGQGRTIEISIENEIEAQIDGEPFKMKSCSTVISWHNQAPVLLNQVKDKNYKQMKKLLQNYNDYEKRENLLTYIEKLEKANYANEDLQFLKECIENVDNPTHLLTIFDQRINRLPPPALPPKPKEWKKFDSAFRTLEHIDLDGVSQPIPKITESEPYTRESEPLSAREPRKKSKKKATAQEKVFSSNTLKPKTVSVESSSPTTEKPSHSKTTRKKHERSRSTSPPKNAITLI
eukprot:TRINITY_DN73_c1_g5_i1.p1 TRINITY_DN73_c1_g5~~TRINITY_DN73_c1_g5_i1.p1  ORF type:complete len:648 (-),score=202.80 TRINITY_DN73_c1_g5_i1:24-1967(-)